MWEMEEVKILIQFRGREREEEGERKKLTYYREKETIKNLKST